MPQLRSRTLLTLLIASACVPSLHPLYTDADLFVDRRLIGAWVGVEDSKTPAAWKFARSGDDGYSLTHTAEGKTAQFSAHLVRLRDFVFLDIQPRQEQGKLNEMLEAHLIGAHTFSRIWVEDDHVRMRSLDEEWLKRMLREKKFLIAHEIINGRILLTASTATLQRFAIKYADDTLAFAHTQEWRRKK